MIYFSGYTYRSACVDNVKYLLYDNRGALHFDASDGDLSSKLKSHNCLNRI